MSEMIERIARAIYLDRYPDETWDEGSPFRKDYLRGAKVALEAMRDHPPVEVDMDTWGTTPGNEVWRSCIDAALSEKPQDITVACKCGWQGRQSELNGNLCPKCSAPFKAVP